MNTNYDRTMLYQLAEKAARALKLKDGLYTLLRHLIHRIPRGALHPVSPASPGELANVLGLSDRAIRSRVKKLLDLGLVRDARLANGRRCVERDHDRRIISIAGLDLTPLLEHAEELTERVAVMEARQQEHQRLCRDISRRRRDLKTDIANPDTPKEAIELWSSLPQRLAGLSLDALHQLVDNLNRLADLISRDRTISADRPEENDRQYLTNYNQSESCKPPVCAENRDNGETLRSGLADGLPVNGRRSAPSPVSGEDRKQRRGVSRQNAKTPPDASSRVAEAREQFLVNAARMITQRSNACGSIKPATVIELLHRGLVTREACRRASVSVPASYRNAALITGGSQDAED